VLRGRALEPGRFLVDPVELPLVDVGVVALELLLGLELLAEVGNLAGAPLAVLARPRGPTVEGALRASPDILAEAAIDLMLGANALGHPRLRLSICTGSGAFSSGDAPGPWAAGRVARQATEARRREGANTTRAPKGPRCLYVAAKRRLVKLLSEASFLL
jgi:hypothetical protein